MLNAVIFALHKDNAREAMQRLQRENIINIVEWLGLRSEGQGVITVDYGDLQDVEKLKKYSEVCPQAIYDTVYQRLYLFLDMIYRGGDLPIYEYVNMFNLWVNYYYGMFKTQKVDVLIFSDNPHFGVDSIAKEVADAMGIKTVMFMQSLYTNHFFAFSNVDDIGVFETLPNDDHVAVDLEQKYEKDLSYMKNIKIFDPYKIEKANTAGTGLISKIKKHRNNLVAKTKAKIYGELAKKYRVSYANVIYHEAYSKALANMDIDLDKKFIYFPLHMQPEMTTSVLGKEYCDQMLAIERLAEFIPDDWMIYVKENPKQSYYMRERLFFTRVAMQNKVRFVGREYNTYDLIKNSQFVATIAGTAGWEAISGGKNVLVFGLAWYRKLPGVFEFKDKPTLDEIMTYKVNHDELNEAYNKLISKSYVGILECGGESEVPDYTSEKNNVYIYEAMKKILSQMF